MDSTSSMKSFTRNLIFLCVGAVLIVGYLAYSAKRIVSTGEQPFGVSVIAPGASGSGGLSQFPAGSTSTGQTSTSGTPNVIPMGYYTTVPVTLTTSSTNPLLVDVSGNLKVAEQFAPASEDNTNSVSAQAIRPLSINTYSWTLATSTPSGSAVIKSTPGNLFSFNCVNTSTVPYIVQFYNTSTAPFTGTIPLITFPIAGNSTLSPSNQIFGQNGYNFSLGIDLAVSTVTSSYSAGPSSLPVFCSVFYK